MPKQLDELVMQLAESLEQTPEKPVYYLVFCFFVKSSMTRSSSGPLAAPLADPESAFRKPHREEPLPNPEFSDSEPEENPMADMANMTLEEYAARTTQAVPLGVMRPRIPNGTNFELKGHILSMLREIPFTGNEDEDAHSHVEEVLEIADYFKIQGVAEDAILLRIFPITLKGNARKWLKSQPSSEMDTWEKVKGKFLKQFSPPSRVAKLKAKINNFEQTEDEGLYEAWTRFKDLLKACPNHDLNAHQVLQTFYNGLNIFTRQVVDSQGPLTKKPAEEARALVQELADHSHQWHSRGSAVRQLNNLEGHDEIASLRATVESLGRDMKKMEHTVHAIRVGCDNCGGPHLTKDCDLDENGNKKASVCVSSGDRYDDWRGKRGWLPPDEYKREMARKYKQSAPGFYQQQQPLETPVQTEPKASIEDVVAKFVQASERRHKEAEEGTRKMGEMFEKRLKDLGAATETTLRNQQASILNIEAQVGQMSRLLQDRLPGSLPSNTERNPNAP